MTGKNNRIPVFKIRMLFDLFAVLYPLNDWSICATQLMDYFLRVFFFWEAICVFLVALLIPLFSVQFTLVRVDFCFRGKVFCRASFSGSFNGGGVSKRGNKTLTRTGCDWITEGWLYSRRAIWKLTLGICFCMLRFSSLVCGAGCQFFYCIEFECGVRGQFCGLEAFFGRCFLFFGLSQMSVLLGKSSSKDKLKYFISMLFISRTKLNKRFYRCDSFILVSIFFFCILAVILISKFKFKSLF